MSHRTRLGLPARPGWLVREQVECMSPDGSLHVLAFSEPVQESATKDYAAGYGQLLENLPGYEEIDVRDVQLFGGRDAVLRRYQHVPAEGAPLTQVAAYLVDGGIGHVVTATTTSSRFGSIEGDLLALLSEIELDAGSAQERAAGRESVSPAPRPDASWGDVRKSWEATTRSRSARAVNTEEVGDLTPDELVAAATLAGATTFPFLDDSDTADVFGPAAPAILRSALRSLSARGLTSSAAGGSLTACRGLDTAVRLALDPDLIVTIETDGDEAHRVAIAVDVSRTVEVHRLDGSIHRLAAGAAEDLLARISQLTHVQAAATTVEGEHLEVPAIAIDRARAFLRTGDRDGAARELEGRAPLLEALGDARSFTRLRTVFRSGGVVHGGEVTWAQTRSGAAWVLEPIEGEGGPATSVQARIVTRKELYAELLALLP